MPRQNKTDQLRVRLTAKERTNLEQHCLDRKNETGKDYTISDVIREHLAHIIQGQGAQAFELPSYESGLLLGLASLLKRTPSAVLCQIIKDIAVMAEQHPHDAICKTVGIPMTVREIRLRRAYFEKDAKHSVEIVAKVHASLPFDPMAQYPQTIGEVPEESEENLKPLSNADMKVIDDILKNGPHNKILAIKEWRARAGCGLADAKVAVEEYMVERETKKQ